MSIQTSPDPELPFFRARSLRPRARRTCSSEIDISPKATPTITKPSNKAKRPDHVRLPSGHFFDRIGLRERLDRSRTTSEEEVNPPWPVGSILASSKPAIVFDRAERTRTASGEIANIPRPEVPVHATPGPIISSQDALPVSATGAPKNQLQPTSMRAPSKSVPSNPRQKGGLYRRAMLRLGVTSKEAVTKRPQLEISPARSFTGQILDRASTILRRVPEKRRATASSDSSNKSTTGSSAPRSFLWPLRKAHSNSSSLRNVLMGEVPLGTPTTPSSELMYMGSDQRQYFRVEISAPGAPTYLPSEASRIGTPPLNEQNSKGRGFVFNYDVRDDETEILSSDIVERAKFGRKRTSDIEWFSVELKTDEARDKAMGFEINVPEHLPSSPLCPRNPKHKSEGKGICVYHGRNKREGDGL
ncbi:MAG: accessory factor associated with RNA polymerase II [Heterodermia speciosa]|uniref:Accessory factor associated with RNA polymerase II n=1 Tax=Heterodermia speciosa TaxID=116794 RepID=A0A8H3FSR1_9LECA|nr:MAG: accessory factor associated with RNA polymerase II [Heterodermia speciosa]